MAMTNEAPKVSEFYTACRNGNVEFVRNYLKTHSATKNDSNKLEPIVNSTPLHAASYNGHTEIVQLLIEHGCERSLRNGCGLTACEEAANDQIRQLFQRPAGKSGVLRFQEANTNECFGVIEKPKEQKNKSKSKKKN